MIVFDAITSIATLLAVGVAAVGVVFTLRQVKHQTRQQKLELGNLYLTRYWQIDDNLLLSEKGTDDHARHRHRYLRLCEDEYEAARRDWLDSGQWEAWHEWLVSDRTIGLLEADLELCDPQGTRFSSIRRCIEQVGRDGKTHAAGSCDSIR